MDNPFPPFKNALNEFDRVMKEEHGEYVQKTYFLLMFYSGRTCVHFIMNSKSIPSGKTKAFEMVARLFKTGKARVPRNMNSWYSKNRHRLDLILQGERWPKKQAGEDFKKIGPFTVHDTVGFTSGGWGDVQKIMGLVTAAVKGINLPGFQSIADVHVYLVGRLEKTKTLAWYAPSKDLIYLRPKLRGRGNQDIALNFIHELSHRYWRKKMASTAKSKWLTYNRECHTTSKVKLPEPGFVFPEWFQANGKQIMVDRYEDGDYHLRDPKTNNEIGSIPARRMFDWMEKLAKSNNFPSLYAMKSDAEEHFCEVVAYSAMGKWDDRVLLSLN